MNDHHHNGDVARQAQVTLYTRPGCHLCEQAKREILAANCRDLFTLQEINIDTDAALVRRYGWDIPVVTINGIETFKHCFTATEFQREVRRTLDSINDANRGLKSGR